MDSDGEKILVVDDDGYIRKLVVRILTQRGYRAVPAADAWQAMDLLQKHAIDLIILDLRMPGPLDGEQLLFALRDQGNDTPIVVVSGWVDDELSQNPPACVHAIMQKPIDIDDFTATVEGALRKAS